MSRLLLFPGLDFMVHLLSPFCFLLIPLVQHRGRRKATSRDTGCLGPQLSAGKSNGLVLWVSPLLHPSWVQDQESLPCASVSPPGKWGAGPGGRGLSDYPCVGTGRGGTWHRYRILGGFGNPQGSLLVRGWGGGERTGEGGSALPLPSEVWPIDICLLRLSRFHLLLGSEDLTSAETHMKQRP